MKISKLLIKSAIIGAILAAPLPVFADSGSNAHTEDIQQINHLAAKVYDLQHQIVRNERVQYDELVRIESDSMFGGHAPSKDMLRYRVAGVLAHTFNGGDLQYLQSHLIQVKDKARQVIWLFPGLVGALRADNNQVLVDIVKGGNSSKGNQKYIEPGFHVLIARSEHAESQITGLFMQALHKEGLNMRQIKTDIRIDKTQAYENIVLKESHHDM